MLSARVGLFKINSGEKELQGLRNDVQMILVNTVEFLKKAKIFVEAIHIEYGRVINTGLCNAWKEVYKDYIGDDGHPNDFDFKQFVTKADNIINAFKLAVILLGTTYEDKDKNNLIIQIYENMIHIQETVRDSCSYEINYNYYGTKSYNVSLSLNSNGKAKRNKEIAQWKNAISEVKAKGAQKAIELAKRKRDQYWEEHADDKLKLEEEMNALRLEKDELYAKINALNEDKTTVPAAKELQNIEERISAQRLSKSNLSLFKGKEKKNIQGRIDELEKEADDLKGLVAEQQIDIEEKIAPLNSRLNEVLNRIREIENEFTKER